MDDDQQFCLRWNNHQSTLISVFDTLLENETLVDCTLAAEGKFLKAHKVVLSACSPYFATLLQEQYDKHPIFILKDVKYQELRAMMDYMYRGEVNISQDQLAALLKAAESLQIKGLSDNRSGGGASQPKHPEHHRATMPGKLSGGYTLEQTKRARITGAAGPAMDASEMGSREGSSSPSRRRRKVRRRSIENPMTDVHDNSNSSQQPTQSNAPGLGAITAAASALAAAAAGAPSSAAAAAALASTVVPLSATQQQHQSSTSAVTPAATGSTLSSSKKTDNVKGSTQQHQQQQQDAINTDNVQGSAAGSLATGTPAMDTETATDASTADKSNHKQQLQQQQKASASKDTSSVTGSELVIEPKAEYDDEANDETVEDLTLDEEDMGMDDLDHNAGTSQGGEGSSQGYAPWQHDRSQDELLLATQEAQQRDPQAKQDKSEQTDISPDDFELDDCLLESNDIVITQNKDGFILHVKKLGNITTAKLSSQDEDQVAAAAVAAATSGGGSHISQSPSSHSSGIAQHQSSTAQITEIQEIPDVKPTFTTLTTSPAIKLPSSECELINLKKIIPASTTISTHHPHATIIQTQQIQPAQIQHHHQQQQQHHQQHHQQQQHHHQQQQQQHHHHSHHQQPEHQEIIIHQAQPQQQHHQLQQHPQVQSIVTTSPTTQTINLMGLRNVQITEQKPIVSRIKYSRGKIITPTTAGNVQIVQAHDAQTHEITDGTKYEISEIDLNNPQTSAAIISDLVKYAEIDDIELPDGTKIGIGFAPTEITEHMQTTGGGTTAQITTIEADGTQQHHQIQTHPTQQHHHHQQLHGGQVHHIQTVQSAGGQQQQQHHIVQQASGATHVVHHQQLHLQEQDDNTTSVEAILPDTITVHEQPTITKSYTILTARPMKQESSQLVEMDHTTNTGATTYELSLSDSSLGPSEDRGDESKYVCRHCGKKYRWKSTLRRHENVECGGKEPCHPCPYCSYKAKQRGNLGVHVRKHHPDKPQLESKRGRKI
ncbi:longitudinals lacking protein, isoforms F/I/K/T isoform X2 [Musca domestica]|uniref:Longitudinals lacking protein, isoforms F/I/K/T isoform X2 n=1 Tax=Musca domestica TaxID=7370 RepID=A0A1I8NAY8_MUSDO|nr:longitudinals lacking protein, isoforms F/I/K/T isoform X2 [Musca domestica]